VRHAKLIATLVSIMAIVVIIELYFGFLQHHQVANNVKIDGVFLAQAQPIANFELTDNHGKPFNQKNLQGLICVTRWHLKSNYILLLQKCK
jgi:cytochrome oxidase Cu insertion factor (SCO1/SenC/PrrC family)